LPAPGCRFGAVIQPVRSFWGRRLPSHRSSFDEWFALYDAIPDNAPEEKFARLAPQPKNLTRKQRFKIIDRAHFPADFMANRKTSMPRDLDLF
jgi:hypothetical protein